LEKVMRVNARGQVTIPWKIREELGLTPGTEVEFFMEGNSLILERVRTLLPSDPDDSEFSIDQARALLTPEELLALSGETS
jgi:AbrB family looped-hinge helix DNA binding protein